MTLKRSPNLVKQGADRALILLPQQEHGRLTLI